MTKIVVGSNSCFNTADRTWVEKKKNPLTYSHLLVAFKYSNRNMYMAYDWSTETRT